MKDTVTFLTSLGPVLAKRWTPDGIAGYDRAKRFWVSVHPVDDIRDLSDLLRTLQTERASCVIRGHPVDGLDLTEPVERNLENFEDRPHHWACLDVDSHDTGDAAWFLAPETHINRFIREHLPDEFNGASFHWQLSNSAGAPGKETLLKVHLWFWFRDPCTSPTLERWVRVHDIPVDPTVFRTVQVHYTAAPVIEASATCPVPLGLRCGFVEGWASDEVDLDPDADIGAIEAPPRDRPPAGGARALLDPREKSGVIGAFCRAYPPDRAVNELLTEHFEWEGDSGVRLTWLRGGGAAGGACVTDDGQHIYNSHATDPFAGRAANVFDVCRVHLFGGDPDDPKSGFDETAAFARSLDDVRDELRSSRPSAAEEFADFEDDEPPTPAEDRHAVAPADREQVVLRALTAVQAAPTATALEQDTAARLRDLDWTDGERERLARAMQQRYADLTGNRLPIATARKWLVPTPSATGATWPDLDADGAPKMTVSNLQFLLGQLGAVIRYNVIAKADEILIPGAAELRDGAAANALTLLWSECHRVGFHIGIQMLQDYVRLLAHSNAYNPALTWVESAPWDGVDRLGALYDTIDSPQRELKEMLLRKWLLQSIAILHNDGSNGLMARGCLVFQGVQYQGKTRWVKALAPADLVQQGMTLDPHNKDSVVIALSHWLCELGELDATFKRSDLSALKSFLSQQVDKVRLPYARKQAEFPRRTSFFASVNDEEFLHDKTGNSRYWVVPVDAVREPVGIDMQQLWAQVLHIWRTTGEPHWLTAAEMAQLEDSNATFAVVSPVEERVFDRFAWDNPEAQVIWASTAQIAEHMGLSRPTAVDSRAIASALRKAWKVSGRSPEGRGGAPERLLHGRKLFAVPMEVDAG